MAKKTTNITDENFDLDADLDDFSFDFKDPFVKDDRKPALKFTSGLKDGAKGTLKDSRFIKEALKEVFPPSFGQTLSLADDVTQTIKSLYDESVRDIKPTLHMARQTVAKLIPADSKLLPQAAKDVLKRWSKEQSDDAGIEQGPSKSQLREVQITGTLQDIFKVQLATQQHEKAIADGNARLKEGVEIIRHRSLLDATNRTAISLSRIDNYNTRINLGFQKKQLELGYRQLFAMQDILEFQREDAGRRDGILLAISKNTGLPEFVKIQDKEARAQLSKNKRFEAVHSAMFGGRDQMIATTLKSAKEKALKAVRDATAGARMGMLAASMGGDSNFGMDATTAAGMMAGSVGTGYLGKRAGEWLGNKLTGSALDKHLGITNKFKKLDTGLENLPGKISDFKKNKKYAWQGGIGGSLMQMLQGLMPDMGIDTKLVSLKAKDMDSPYHFTRRADRSLNVVIPGFLARIYRELQVTRTGNTKISLTGYDHDDSRFTSADKLEKKIFGTIVSKGAVDETQSRLEKILDLTDPDHKLTPKQREGLRKHLLKKSAGGSSATEDNLATQNAYTHLNNEDSAAVSAHMRGFLRNQGEDKKLEFTRRFNGLATSIPDVRQTIQDHLDLGNKSALRKNKFISKAGDDIVLDEILNHYLDTKNATKHRTRASYDPEMAGGMAFGNMARQLRPKKTWKGAAGAAKEATHDGIVSMIDAMRMGGPNSVGSRAKSTLKGVADIVNKAAASVNSAADVYLRGDRAPRLTTGGILSGSYINAANQKVIAKLSDITGEVRDKSGNVLLSADEALKAYVIDPVGKLSKALSQSGAELKTTPVEFSTTGISGFAKSFVNDTVKEFTQQMADNDDGDIRIAGEEEPRLTQVGIRAGQYVNQETGETVRKHADVDATIVDKQTGQVAITKEELPRMLKFNMRLRKWSPLWIGSKIISGLWHYQTKIAPKWAAWNLRMLWNGSVGATKMIGSALGFSGRAMGISKKKPKDVYVRGEDKPRLNGIDFLRGAYRDLESGAILSSEKDIKGTVIDANGVVVLPEKDLDKLFTKDSLWGKLNPLKLVGWIARTAIHYTLKVAPGLAWSGLKMLGRASLMAGKGILMLAGLRLSAQDVYANGEEIAVLDGITMKKGQYYNADDKSVITSPSDIHGPVIDSSTGQTVLTADHIAAGLRTVNGTAVKIKPSLLSRGIHAAGFIGRKIGSAIGSIVGLKVKTKLKIKKGAPAPTTQAEVAAIESSNTLDKILSAIKDMGKPKGPRKGSYLDEQANKLKDAGGAKIGGIAAKAKAKGKGLISKIAGGVQEAGGLWSAAKSFLAGGAEAAVGAGGATLMAGGAAAETAAAATAATAATATAAAGGGMMAAIGLAAPVILGVAAVGLLAYGGYKLYKAYTKGDISKLAGIRMTQYGIMPGDTDTIKKALDLEEYLSDRISSTQNGVDFDYKKVQADKLADAFGIDLRIPKQKESFQQWIAKRFKAVYLTHLTAAKAIGGKPDLSAIDSYKKEDKLKYINATKFPEGPYNYNSLPVFDREVKVAGSTEVVAAIQAAMDELTGKDKDKKTGNLLDKAGAIVGVASANAAETTPGNKKDGATNKFNAGQDNTIAKVAAGAAGSAIEFGTEGGLNALDAVRMKAYGLIKMDSDKVMSLRMLERELISNVKYAGDGTASWDGDSAAILTKIKGYYGIGDVFSAEGTSWLLWFSKRFLPTFVGYLTAVRIKLGKPVSDAFSGAMVLKPNDQLDVAQILIGLAKTWDVPNTPWPNTAVTNDPSLAKPNIEYLKQLVKDRAMQEQKANAPSTKTAPASTAGGGRGNGYNPAPPGNTIAASSSANKAAATGSSPDSEAPVASSGAAPANAGDSSGGTGGLTLATGTMFDGRSAMSFLKIKDGVDLDSVNPELRKQFLGMVEEYGTLTGKSTILRDGFRTKDAQAALKLKYGPRAASPGSSLHEFGLALDVDSKTLDAMDKMGLMRKYGFTRPVGAEPWHMEPIGIQADLAKYKQDASLASQAIIAGAGHGGAGIGSRSGARAYSRNRDDSIAIATASVTETDPKANSSAGGIGIASAATPSRVPTPVSAMMGPSGSTTVASNSAANLPTTVGAANDGEIKPSGAGGSGPLSTQVNAPGSQGTPYANSNSPADPTIKIPDPTGNGIEGMRGTITAAAKMVGINPNQLLAEAAVESDFNPNAGAGTSSAMGLFQNTRANWSDLVKNYGGKYGLNSQNASPTDPKAASILTAHFLKSNSDTLAKTLGRQPSITEVYLAHFLGPTGARKFLSALATQPNGIGATLFPGPAAANKSIFFDGQRARTMTEVFAEVDRRIRKKAKSYGIDIGIMASAGNAPGATGAVGYAAGAEAAGAAAGSMPAVAPSAVAPQNQPGGSAGNPAPGDSYAGAIGGATAPSAPGSIGSAQYMPSVPPTGYPAPSGGMSQSDADMYGFGSARAMPPMTPPPMVGGVSMDAFSGTTDILKQQLDVQKSIYSVLGQILDKVQGGQANAGQQSGTPASAVDSTQGGPTGGPAAAYEYSLPRVSISMRRAMGAN